MSKSFNKSDLFESVPLPKAIAQLAIPTIISQMITMIYNLADTFFVGKTNDPNQVAAIALAMPAYLSLTSISNLFGIGGGSLLSRCLGRKDQQTARYTAAFAIYGALLVTLLYSLCVAFWITPFSRLLGAQVETLEQTQDYLWWVLVIGGIPTMLNSLLALLVRSEGHAKIASVGLSLGGILNIILDPIFIFPLRLQLVGAAIATALSNTAAMVFFLMFIFHHRRETLITMNPREIRLRRDIVGPTLVIGLPAALQTFLSVISNGVVNNLVSGYSTFAMAGVGIAKKVDLLAMNVTQGLSQGVLPFLAYNYAAKNYNRMGAANRLCRKIAISFSVLTIIIFEVFAPQTISLFIADKDTIYYGGNILRILCLSTPFIAIEFLSTSLFQAADQGKEAFLLSILRKGITDIPLMFLMNKIIPLYGVVMVQPIMDLLVAILAIVLAHRFINKLKSNITTHPQHHFMV